MRTSRPASTTERDVAEALARSQGEQGRWVSITCQLLVVGARDDNITPPPSVKALMTLVGSTDTEYVELSGGHISLIAGSRASIDCWPREKKSCRRLLGRLRAASFVFENDLNLISSLVSYCTGILRDSGMFDESDCHRITTALDEALTNAYYHGNLEVRSEIREHDTRAYRALANDRRALPPYRDRRIQVRTHLTSGEAVFVIKDDGRGFDPWQIPDPTRSENIEHPSGRGVFLTKTFMDHIEYNDVGNEVTLTKRRQKPAVRA